jgi:ribosomal-protein-alanine N-acetyltransferase
MLSGLFNGGGREIRLARAEDAALCALLHAQAFARGWSEHEFESFLTDNAVLAHVAVQARQGPGRQGQGRRERITAFVLSRLALDEAEILSIAVEPASRGRGLARDLLARHKGALAAEGVRRLCLEVEAGNQPARALYAGAGFAEVGRRGAYYAHADGSRADALVLCCERLA